MAEGEVRVRPISCLPSVRSQIQNLSPTHNVVSFYNSKLEKYEKLVAEMSGKLEQFCLGQKYQLNLEKRVRHVMDQNENLRASLSCLSTALIEERQITLQLKVQIARLKMQEVADHKKIQHLLLLHGITDEKLAMLCQKNDLLLTDISEETPSISSQPNGDAPLSATSEIFMLKTDNDFFRLQIKALQAELSERTELALKEQEDLVAEKEALLRDYQLRKASDAVLINDLTEQLDKMQSILHENLQSFIALPKCASMPELNVENKEQKHVVYRPMVSKATSPIRHRNEELSRLQTARSSIKDAQKVPNRTYGETDNHVKQESKYKNKRSVNFCEQHQRKIHSLQEEVSMLKQQLQDEHQNASKCNPLKERVAVLTARNESLERRRKLDYEGFKSDLGLLRTQLRDIQRQLLKISLIIGNENKSIDLAALEAIDRTKKNSEQIATKLKDLNDQLGQM